MAKNKRQSIIVHKPDCNTENNDIDIEALKKCVGEKIRLERKKVDLTIEQFSELINISSSFLGLIERGERLMSIPTIYTVSKKLNVPVSNFLGEKISGLEKQKANTKLDFYINMLNERQRKRLVKLIQIVFFND